MYFNIYFTRKYWTKHKKNLAALIFAAVMMTAVILTFWLGEREKTNRTINDIYFHDGYRDLQAANLSDDIRRKILTENRGAKLGSSFVYGETDDRNRFSFGTFDDPYDLFHVRFESGHMPAAKGEIAVDRAVLDRLYWVGKCGGNITIGGESYIVSGIFDISHRYGSRLAPSVSGNDDETPTLPLIVFSECEGEPIGRLDYFADIFDKHMTTEQAENSPKYESLTKLLDSGLAETMGWYILDLPGSGEIGDSLSETNADDARYYFLLFFIGAVVAALSVFAVLRAVFKERENDIRIITDMGISRKKRLLLYCTECCLLTAVQTAIGFLAGSAAHLTSVLFKSVFLDEKFISGFSADPFVTSRSYSPFLISGIISVAVMTSAYILNILTAGTCVKLPKKNVRPRSLRRCFSRVFRGGATSVIQVVSLTLIISCCAMCYMNFTHTGKYIQSVMLGAPNDTLLAGGINMEECGIEEYYECQAPDALAVKSIFNPTCGFYITESGYSLGIDDETAAKLPQYAYALGTIQQPFIISEEPLEGFTNQIDFTEEEVRNLLTEFSSDEYKNFFDEGQIGSKYLYQAPIRIVDDKTLSLLSGSTASSEIDINALDSGKEILVISQSRNVTISAGTRLVFGSAVKGENNTGIGSIKVSAPITISRNIMVSQDSGELLQRLFTISENKMRYNFLTTAKGAKTIGFHGARYTEIFSEKETDGSVIPSSAKMNLTTQSSLKRELTVERLKKAFAVVMTVIMMSLLGFAAYFNGIGIKIRNKAFEISALRALGMSLKRLKMTLILNSVKTVILAFGIGYSALKLMQIAADRIADSWDEMWTAKSEFVQTLHDTGLMRNNWWQASLELPMVILLFVFTAVTILLTLAALRKYKNNIVDALNSGRKKQ